MGKIESNRTGIIMPQPTGYDSFIPKKLFPDGADIDMSDELIYLLSEADIALGELKGRTKELPNPDLFIAFYVQKEALLSSQIEGTECSLDEVITVDKKTLTVKPVQEVINYINAMNQGLEELKNIPMSLRLIHGIHETLLKNVRGRDKNPGEYKRSQNWIGPTGCSLSEAIYVPPPPGTMIDLMGDWENYYHDKRKVSPLIKAAILHAHFETIHPYVDGNGRLGRLLITFMLCEKKVLDDPILYLSLFFKENKSEYYKLLMNIRFKGQWEEWIKFFLRGVRSTSEEAITTAEEIKNLLKENFDQVKTKLASSHVAISLYELFCQTPIMSIAEASRKIPSTYPTTKKAIEGMASLGILEKYDEEEKKNIFVYNKYLNILRRGT